MTVLRQTDKCMSTCVTRRRKGRSPQHLRTCLLGKPLTRTTRLTHCCISSPARWPHYTTVCSMWIERPLQWRGCHLAFFQRKKERCQTHVCELVRDWTGTGSCNMLAPTGNTFHVCIYQKSVCRLAIWWHFQEGHRYGISQCSTRAVYLSTKWNLSCLCFCGFSVSCLHNPTGTRGFGRG